MKVKRVGSILCGVYSICVCVCVCTVYVCVCVDGVCMCTVYVCVQYMCVCYRVGHKFLRGGNVKVVDFTFPALPHLIISFIPHPFQQRNFNTPTIYS